MRKNYVHLVLLLLLNISMFGQTVTLTPTLVNGVAYSGGPINLKSTPTSTISLSVKVDIPSAAAVGDQGTIKIYFSKGTALGSVVASGGDGGALYFGNGKVATRSIVINLNWSDFLTSGGFIFAEYKSSKAYVSSNISVIKNSTVTTGTNLNPPADAPNPKKIVNTLCCNQTIRLGDKPAPITGSQYLNPYEGLPYGVNRRWNIANSWDVIADYINEILYLDYTTELKDITINRELGYVYGGEFPNKSNTVKIKVVPSPITSNEISIDTPINSEGFYEIISTNPKQISGATQRLGVNLNILADPFHTPKRGDSYTNIEKFEWEYTKTNAGLGGLKNWMTISGENDYFLESFNPSEISNIEDNYYLLRRIAIYQNIKRVSNTLKIVLRTIRLNNTICCDQTLVISASNTINSPTTIVGSEAISNSNQYFTYQWQSQSIDYNNGGKISNWSNISGAKAKDYTPPPLQLVLNQRRGVNEWSTPVTYNYRRITETQAYKGETSYSNEVNLNSLNQYPDIIMYPNPASSVINIENKNYAYKADTTLVSIINSMGETVNSNNFSLITPYIISIDISNLPMGVYFINIQSTPTRITKLTFIKQ